MKKFCYLFCVCWFMNSPSAISQSGAPQQQSPPPPVKAGVADPTLSEQVNNLRAKTTPSIEAEYVNVEGDPFLADWLPGAIRLKNGKFVKDLVLKFDLHKNKLYFLRDRRAWEFVDSVRDFYLENVDGNTLGFVYRNGFPAINKNTEQTYYEVFVEGRLCLLKYHYRKLMKMNGPTANQVKGKLEDKGDWYAFLPDKRIIKLTSNEKSLVRDLPGYEEAIQSVIQEFKPNLRTDDGMTMLFQQLNK